MPGRMQNDLPLSPALRVRVRLGGAVGVAEPQAAAAGGAVEGAGAAGWPARRRTGLLLPAGSGQGRHPDDRGGEKRDAAHAYLPVTAGDGGGQFWMNPRGLDAQQPGSVPAGIDSVR